MYDITPAAAEGVAGASFIPTHTPPWLRAQRGPPLPPIPPPVVAEGSTGTPHPYFPIPCSCWGRCSGFL